MAEWYEAIGSDGRRGTFAGALLRFVGRGLPNSETIQVGREMWAQHLQDEGFYLTYPPEGLNPKLFNNNGEPTPHLATSAKKILDICHSVPEYVRYTGNKHIDDVMLIGSQAAGSRTTKNRKGSDIDLLLLTSEFGEGGTVATGIREKILQKYHRYSENITFSQFVDLGKAGIVDCFLDCKLPNPRLPKYRKQGITAYYSFRAGGWFSNQEVLFGEGREWYEVLVYPNNQDMQLLEADSQSRIHELNDINYMIVDPPGRLNPRWFEASGAINTTTLEWINKAAEWIMHNGMLQHTLKRTSIKDVYIVGSQAQGYKEEGDLDLYFQLESVPNNTGGRGMHSSAKGPIIIRNYVRRVLNNLHPVDDIEEYFASQGKSNFVDIFMGTNPPDITDEKNLGDKQYYSVRANAWISNVPGKTIIADY